MLLGALTRQMNNMAILSPRPTAPYAGLSFAELRYRKHPCSLDAVIREVNQVYKRADGLRLREFVDRAESTTDIVSRHSELQ